jgi:tryptophan-rich sensory protein
VLTSKVLTRIGLSVLACLAVGFISGAATSSSVDTWYAALEKPSFTPPNYLFAPVWTVLYVCMGVAAGVVWSRGFHHRWVKTALYFFVFQLVFNALWSLVFFGTQNTGMGLVVISILIPLIVITIRKFRVVSIKGAWLMVPYLAWVSFAWVLNFEIWRLNP